MSRLIIFATVSVGVFAFVVITLANPAYAANPSTTPKGNQIVQELKERRCERIGSFIDARIERYNENKDRHIQNHQKILEKIQNLVNSLKSKGYDVSKISSDYNTLNNMSKSFASQYTTFIKLLEQTKELGCGENEEIYKTKLEESRDALKLAREQAQAIWKYINTTIRDDLNELKTKANSATENN